MQESFNSKIDNLIQHPAQKLPFQKLVFKKDWKIFNVKDKIIYCVEVSGEGFNEKSNDAFVNKVKVFIKKSPHIFYWVYHLMNPSFAKINAKKLLEGVPSGKVILNFGSGATSIRPDVINIDFYPFENVNFVADIADLPFGDRVADVVVSECVLEHTPNPKAVVSEMYRVLKPNGLVYVVVPFVFSFHSSPVDFYRWSMMGMEQMFKDFERVDSGIHFGPGNALNWILAEFFGTIFSFGWKKLHQVLFILFLILFFPLGYLDIILNRFQSSENIASHLYFLGRKK